MDNNSVLELEKINKNGINENSENKNESVYIHAPSAFRRQVITSFGVFMMTLGAGATLGFSAILIPQLLLARNDMSIELISWIAAMSSLALFFGNMLSGYLMERCGRRLSLLILATCFIFGWLVIGFSNGLLFLILIGRFITGLCQGWLGPLGPVFVGEISSPAHRGFFLASLSLAIAVGVFFAHLFGTFLHWTISSILCGLFPLIGGIIIYYASESPVWLASKNRIDDCVTSFHWYRGRSLATETELEKMLMDLKNKNKVQSKIKAFAVNIKKPEFYKPLFIMIVFFIVCQLTGVNVISAYTIELVKELLGNSLNSSYTYTAMLSIDVLRCGALGVACVLLRTTGRRPMALFSGAFTSISLIVLALYLYLHYIGVIENISPFITLGVMAFYIAVSNMGIALLPWNMVGELFAVEMKGVGSGVSVMMTSIAFFATVKLAPGMIKSLGIHGTFLFYGLATIFGTIFLYFYLPETKNKTLLEIEEHFRYNKKRNIKAVSANI